MVVGGENCLRFCDLEVPMVGDEAGFGFLSVLAAGFDFTVAFVAFLTSVLGLSFFRFPNFSPDPP